MKRTKKSEQGFSLVEMAIVMVIIGLIVAAVTVGKSTMKSAETLKAYQKVVVPCVAAVSEAIRNGSATATADYPTIKLGGKELECQFLVNNGVVNRVKIKEAPKDLRDLMRKNLHNNIDVKVEVDSKIVQLYVPGGDPL